MDGERRPRDFAGLLKVVTSLSTWAGELPVDEERWRRLHATAWRGGSPPHKRRKRAWIGGVIGTLALGAVGALIGTIVTGAASPIGPAIATKIGLSHSSASPSPSAETLQASASWCCTLTSVESSVGFYWTGSASSLNALLESGSFAKEPLTAAGVGIVEIPLQTSGDESIYVGPPQIQVLTRKTNVGSGVIGIIPVGGQGAGGASEFMADIDATEPHTVTYAIGSKGAAALSTAPAYYYVSSGSPEILLFEVRDTGCDCTFDVRLNWQAQGHDYSRVIEDGNQPFHIVGSSGLPWYSGDPDLGMSLEPVGGHSFPAG